MRTGIKLALLGLPVLILGGALALRPATAPPPKRLIVEEAPGQPESDRPAGPKIARLQALALHSCQCERRHEGKKDKEACWRPFYAAVAPVAPSEEGLMLCGDPAEHFIELPTGETIVTRYVSSTALFCTKDEARIAQAAYNEAQLRREKDRTAPAPDDILEQLAAKFARGDLQQTARRDVGCTSG